MPGRRWSDGLHQAVEAKEGVAIERETRTYATITIQNYFRMYEKLAGMTGTAETEATEFNEIYRLAVQVIPTNRPCIRTDKNDSIFKTRRDKYTAVVREIEAANKRGQPVLVGTTSVESSEVLSRMLRRTGVIHTVLNAKFHQQEAEIVSRAGHRSAVTIATNMAGRGTDIKLGEGVRDLGGLMVIGTERHESRRVDRQLRGRCSRQGDPGLTKFFLSLEDDLMRRFLQGNLASRLMEGSMQEGEELEHPWLNRSIESAQKKVEQQNFAIRKRLLQYDDVLNQQREVVYGIRNGAILADRPKEIIFEQVEEEIGERLAMAGFGEKIEPNPVTLDGLVGWVNAHFPIGLKQEELTQGDPEALRKLILGRIQAAYGVKEAAEIPEALGALERYVVINAIDHHWQEHLTEMEELRRGIQLRSYGQKDPLVEYKAEAYTYFEELMKNVRLQICTGIFRSATNLKSFENMLSILGRSVRDPGAGERAAAAAPPPPPPSPASAAAPLPARARARAAIAEGHDPPRTAQGRPQRSVPLRQRQEIQELPRRLTPVPCPPPTPRPPSAIRTISRSLPPGVGGPIWPRPGRYSILTAALTVGAFPPFRAPEFAYVFAVPALFWACRRPPFKLFAWTLFAAQAVAWTVLSLAASGLLGWACSSSGRSSGFGSGGWYLAAWWAMPRIVGRPTPVRIAGQLGLAGLWVVIEWSRTWLLGGFPGCPWAPASGSARASCRWPRSPAPAAFRLCCIDDEFWRRRLRPPAVFRGAGEASPAEPGVSAGAVYPAGLPLPFRHRDGQPRAVLGAGRPDRAASIRRSPI